MRHSVRPDTALRRRVHPSACQAAVRTSCVPSVYRLANVLVRLRHPVRTERVSRVATVWGQQDPKTVRVFHPPSPAGVFAAPMAEPSAPAAPVKEDKDYVAEVIRQL